MAVIKTLDYGILTNHIQKIDEVFNDAMQDSLAKSVGMTIFDTQQNSNRNDNIQLNHGLGGVKYIPENEDFPEATGQEGDFIRFKKEKYGADVVITYESRKYDEYDQIEENVRSIVDEGYNKIEQSLADIMTHGFLSTAYTDVYGKSVTPVGPDGLQLFYGSHTNGTTSNTYSNLITLQSTSTNNPTMSRQAIIDTRVKGMRYKDPQGVIRPIMYDTILVAPELEDYAHRILNSDQVAGSANNDTNSSIKGKIQVKTRPHLSIRSDGTDTSNYWFMYDSGKVKRTLKSYFADYPTLLSPKEFDPNRNRHYLFQYMYSRGFSWAPYVAGSNGTNS